MIKLADGRGLLYQWDTGRQVECDAKQVHFSNHHYGTSIDVDVQNGKATIPNQLLTSATPLKAWAWVTDSNGEYTKEEQIFIVEKRNKPSDYVYTPTEIKTWQDLQNQIGDLSNLTTAHKDNLVNAINDAAGSGGGAGDISAEDVKYTNPYVSWVNVKQALDDCYDYFDVFETAIGGLAKSAHTHDNKTVLDKFAETDGKPTYNGEALGGGGAGDFIIKMTVESDYSGNYTVTSCDATFEQIDAAYNSDKNIVLKVAASGHQGNFSCSLPVVSAAQGSYYYFCGLDGLYVYLAFFGPDYSKFSASNFSANNITYSNAALPNISTVGGALDELVPKSHTHSNKDTLDKLSVSNGKLQYNGSDVGLKGDKGDPGSDANVTKANVITALGYTPEAVSTQVTTGSNITLADNTEYRLTDVTTLTLTYPTGNFECWMRLTFAASGNATVTLPTGTKYIGTTPDFKNGETWEMSIKDGVVIAQKVGDGT